MCLIFILFFMVTNFIKYSFRENYIHNIHFLSSQCHDLIHFFVTISLILFYAINFREIYTNNH